MPLSDAHCCPSPPSPVPPSFPAPFFDLPDPCFLLLAVFGAPVLLEASADEASVPSADTVGRSVM